RSDLDVLIRGLRRRRLLSRRWKEPDPFITAVIARDELPPPALLAVTAADEDAPWRYRVAAMVAVPVAAAISLRPFGAMTRVMLAREKPLAWREDSASPPVNPPSHPDCRAHVTVFSS